MRIRGMFRFGFMIAAGLALAAPAAMAGVQMESHAKTSGIAGMMGHEEDQMEFYEGAKYRRDSYLKFTGSILGSLQKFAGSKGKDTVIERYDLKKQWQVNEDGAVEELPLLSKDQAKSVAKSMKGGNQQQEKRRVEHLKLTTKGIGGRTVAGRRADGHELTATYVLVDPDTGDRSNAKLVIRRWTASDGTLRRAWKQIAAFNRKYRGITEDQYQLMTLGFGLIGVGSMNEKQMKRIGRALEKMGGFPLATETEFWMEKKESHSSRASSGGGGGLDSMVSGFIGGLISSGAKDMKTEGGLSQVSNTSIEVRKVAVGDVPDHYFERPKPAKSR